MEAFNMNNYTEQEQSEESLKATILCEFVLTTANFISDIPHSPCIRSLRSART